MKISKTLIAINIICIIAFIITLALVYNHQPPQLDKTINSFMPSIQTSFLVSLSTGIGIIFDTKFLIIACLLLCIFIFLKGLKKESSFFALSTLAGAALVFILKEIIQRARPLNSLITETDYGFPSAHTMMSIIFLGFLAYLAIKNLKKEQKFLRRTIIKTAILLMLIISFSRLILNVHWFTDILAGIFLAIFVLTSAIILDAIFIKNKN
jgi:undecaprenyl-diphosphatase